LTNLLDNVVIGSGPAGVAAARALLDQGLDVTLIDAGREMPAAAKSLQDQLAQGEPGQWSEATRKRLRQGGLKDHAKVPLKLLFGSDFPYAADPRISESGASILPSLARGGLSNVWGAAIMPASEQDTANWPIKAADLTPHYQSVLKWLPHAQARDDLADRFPLYSDQAQALALSSQAEAMHADMQSGREDLAASGMVSGKARLAIEGCQYCGLCIHGCPWGAIYNSAVTLQNLLSKHGLKYHPGSTVRSITESAHAVTLEIESREGLQTLQARRVFLAAGVLNSALLLYKVLNGPEFRIRDTAYMLVPFLRRKNTPGVQGERLYTLAQLFTEVNDPAISRQNIHLQWYSYNDLYEEEFAKKFGPLMPLLKPMINKWLLGRLWTAQVFLHSDDSHSMSLQSRDNGESFQLEAIHNPRTEAIMNSLLKKLQQQGRNLGGKPLSFARRNGLPGRSFHAGASLPMSANPGPMESDIFGRPAGLKRVHVVDSSVLPSLPAATITLTVMANAHRIASLHGRYSGVGN
jgi:choline dehydrogenase-like flavoprotein